MVPRSLTLAVVLWLLPLTTLAQSEQPTTCEALFERAVASIRAGGRWAVLKAYRAVRELPNKSVRALQSKVSPDERALACGLMQRLPLPMTAEDRDHVVFACRFPPLAAGDELLRVCTGRIMTRSGVREVYVRSYRDVDGDEFFSFLLSQQSRGVPPKV